MIRYEITKAGSIGEQKPIEDMGKRNHIKLG